MSVRIKMCGITRERDAITASKLHVDAIGLVFFPESKRHVSLQQAQVITQCVNPFVSVVGLFVNPTTQQVEEVLQQVPLHILQFHGDETAEFCRSFQRPYIKGIGVSNIDMPIIDKMSSYHDASAILLDSGGAGYGGTGQTFDWSKIPSTASNSIILAGGLNSVNISEALRQVTPSAVDVSSGVETQPGQKSAELMARFVYEVKSYPFTRKSESADE